MQKSLRCRGLIGIGPFQRRRILLISGPARFCPDSNLLKSVEMSELLQACGADSDKLCVSLTRSFPMMA